MWVESVRLRNFRNYFAEDVSFSPHINLIVGSNGEGKSNLLESLFLLATTKSYRQAHEKDMVFIDRDNFYVSGEAVLQGNIKHTLEISYSQKQNKKQAKVSGVPVVRLADFIGILNVVCFSPDDLNIIKGAPGLRRRFLDILLSQIDRVYLSVLQQYGRVLRQRNECLKAVQRGRMRPTEIWPWTEQLATLACQVTERRFKAVNELTTSYAAISKGINQGKENLSLKYMSSLVKNSHLYTPIEFTESLQRRQTEEVARGITTIGPHRDDLFFLINGLSAADYASQGQQRTAVLSLKLAELEYMYKVTGDYPILLLDDVFSELDQKRRQLLLATLSDRVQALITGTETLEWPWSGDREYCNIINIRQGKVI